MRFGRSIIMELFVDIADLDAVKRLAEYFPIEGFTTNPNILSKASRPVEDMMEEYRSFVQEQGMKIFFQVTGETADEMIREAFRLHEFFRENLVVKLPAVKEGYKAIAACKKAGLNVCVTVIHSTMQAFMAAKAGADYVAPYVSHIDNLGAQAVNVIGEMLDIMQNYDYPCKILGASFRTVEQIKDLAVIGCDAVTITPDMFERLIRHPSTGESMEMFEYAWTKKFGTKEITDLLPY